MPKIKQENYEKRKQQILDAAQKVFLAKPLYKMTMKDVIRESGFSTGSVYSYFPNIDDVIVNLIDRFVSNTKLEQEIDEVMNSNLSIEEKLEKLVINLHHQIMNSITTVGKIQFELVLLLAEDRSREKKLNEKTIKLNKTNFFNKSMDNMLKLIEENVDNGYFKPQYSKTVICSMILIFFDGYIRDFTLLKSYKFSETLPAGITFEEKELPVAFIASILYLLNPNKSNT